MSLKSKLTIALFTTRIRDSLLLKLLIAFLFVWTLLYMARDGLSERNHAQIIANAQLVQLERKFGAQIDSDRTMKYGIHADQIEHDDAAGPTRPPDVLTVQAGIQFKSYHANCGLPNVCPSRHFSIYLHTGISNTIHPQLCVDGKLIFDKGLNGCGRGMNAVIIDNHTQEIIRATNFDSYIKDLTDFELMLLSLRPGDKLILFTFDETLTKMSQIAKLLLHDLGSFEAQNVQFRTAWYLITEKSIQGYTPYEDVHLANQGQWPNPHRLRMCIPPRIVGKQVHPDSSLMRSSKRKRFCMSTRFVWPGFCDVSTINDPLTDGLQLLPNNLSSTLPAWSVSDLINTPVVLVVTSPVNPYLPLALETLVRQPFLQPHNVLLAHYKQDSAAVESLADLFAMRSAVLHSDPAKVAKSLRITIQLLFAGATHLIWLSSQFLLSPDLFLYFAQLLPLLRDPKSELSAISAWNQNSRYLVSSDERVAYRVSSSLVPIQNSFLINVNLMDKCNVLNDYLKILILLSGGAAANLSKDSCPEFHYLMPDLSRILFFDQQKILHEPLSNETEVSPLMDFLNRPVSMNSEALIQDIDKLAISASYEQFLNSEIVKSLKFSDLEQFKLNKNSEISNKTFTLLCEKSTCKQFCTYFGIFDCRPHIRLPLIGFILRFTYMSNVSIYIVGKHRLDFT